MKTKRHFLIVLLILLYFTLKVHGQKVFTVEDMSNMVVCIGDQIGMTIKLRGTGTIITDSCQYYILTATHITDSIKGTCVLVFRTDNDKPVVVPLELFTGRKVNTWKNHQEGDVSIIQISPFDNGSKERLRQWSFPISQILADKQAIPRETSIVVIGYPLVDQLGQHFSPLTFNSFFSSGLITLKRGDTKKPAIFQVLENPSVEGYSGGPVLIGTKRVGVSIGPSKQTIIVGIVHGTYSDNTGGKLAIITSSFYIRELLK